MWRDGKRIIGLVVLAVSGLLLESSRDHAVGAETNFIVFLADDLGWGDLACYGHPRIKTPHLDQFAKQGLRLTQCYSACGVCSPSRSAILTGRTPYRNGVFRWIPEGHECHLRSSEITLPSLLRKQGYQTCHVGKWHLNGHFNSPLQPQPGDHGFDHWFATQNNAAPTHKDPQNFVRNGQPVGKLEGYSAQLVVDEAITWLKQRDRSKPFYLNVWTHEPHLPIESDPKFQALYDTDDVGLKQHHGNVSQLDDAFGRLMRTLDELQLVDSTFVVFTADNGPEGNGQPNAKNPGSQQDRTRGSTGGLRGRKRADFEGGIRVPGIVRWPTHVKAATESATPVVGTDLFATILEVARIEPPSDRTIDAASILPVFRGEAIQRTLPLYWRTHISPPECRVAARVDDWKIVGNADLTRFQLFNIAQDPQETTDRAADEPATFERLKAALLKIDAEIMAEGPDWWKRDAESQSPKKEGKQTGKKAARKAGKQVDEQATKKKSN
jgi:arylsulfatase A